MALEFSGKVVLLVDGEFVSWVSPFSETHDLLCRLDCPRNHLEGDHSDGSRRWSEEGHHGILRTSHPVRRAFTACQARMLTSPVTASYPNVYGIDMPSRHELVAHQRSEAEISEVIGADLVIFQTLPDLIKSCSQFNPSIAEFDCSVFTGKYVTGGVDEDYLAGLETMRSDNAKRKLKPTATAPHGLPLANGHDTSNPTAIIGASMPMDGPDDNDESQVVGLNNARAGNSSDHPDLTVGLSNLGVE